MAANEYAVEMIILLNDIDRTLIVNADSININGLALEPLNLEPESDEVFNTLLIKEMQKVQALFEQYKTDNPGDPIEFHSFLFTHMDYTQKSLLDRNAVLIKLIQKNCAAEAIITPADAASDMYLGQPFDIYMRGKNSVKDADQQAFSSLNNSIKNYSIGLLGFKDFENIVNNPQGLKPENNPNILALKPGNGFYYNNGKRLYYFVKKFDGNVILGEIIPENISDIQHHDACKELIFQLPELQFTSRFALDKIEQHLPGISSSYQDKAIMFKKVVFEIFYNAAQRLNPQQKLDKNIPIEELIQRLNEAHTRGEKININFLLVDDSGQHIDAVTAIFKYYKQKYNILFDFKLRATFLDYNALNDAGEKDGVVVTRRSRSAYSSVITDLSSRLKGPFVPGKSNISEKERKQTLQSPVERVGIPSFSRDKTTPRKLTPKFMVLCEAGEAEALFILAQLAARSGPAYMAISKHSWAKSGVKVDIKGVPQDLIAAYYLAKTAYLRTDNTQLKEELLAFIEIISRDILHEVLAGKLPLYTFMDINSLRPDQLYEIEIAKRKHPLKVAQPISDFFARSPSISGSSSHSDSASSYSSASSSSSVSNSPSTTSIETLPLKEKGGDKPYSPRIIQGSFFEIIETPVGVPTSGLKPSQDKEHSPQKRPSSFTQ